MQYFLKEESTPAGNRKRHTAHWVTSPGELSLSQLGGGVAQSCPGRGGYLTSAGGGGYPSTVLTSGYPVQGYSLARYRIPPSQDWGTPLARTGLPPSMAGTRVHHKGHGTRGWGTPRNYMGPEAGVPPGKDLEPDTWERTWDWSTTPRCKLTNKLKILPSPILRMRTVTIMLMTTKVCDK